MIRKIPRGTLCVREPDGYPRGYVDDENAHEPWCRDFDSHKPVHEFCSHHQSMWCRTCDKGCPSCVDDPRCSDCGCSLYTDYHDWDCSYAD